MHEHTVVARQQFAVLEDEHRRVARKVVALDGPEALWAWVVRTASLVGLVDVVAESPLAAVGRRDNSELLQLLGAEALLMPVGWHHEVAVNRSVVDRLEAELAAERRRADVATAAYEEIRDAFWWRVTGPARRFKDWLRARLPL